MKLKKLKYGDKITVAIGEDDPHTIVYTVSKTGRKGPKNPLYINSPRYRAISSLSLGESCKIRYKKKSVKLTLLEIERKKCKLITFLNKLASNLTRK